MDMLATAAIAKMSRFGWQGLSKDMKLALADLIFNNLSDECVLDQLANTVFFEIIMILNMKDSFICDPCLLTDLI